MSSGVAMRFKGLAAAALALNSAPRPGTKLVSTAPGETAIRRTSGPNTRASDFTITSRPALVAPYTTEEPEPWKPAMEDTCTTSPSPETLSIGAKVRIAAYWPRQLISNMRSMRASSRPSRSVCGTALVKPAELTRMSSRP